MIDYIKFYINPSPELDMIEAKYGAVGFMCYWKLQAYMASIGGRLELHKYEAVFSIKLNKPIGFVQDFIGFLVAIGEVKEEDGFIVFSSVYNQIQEIEKRKKVYKENGSKGGRPPLKTKKKPIGYEQVNQNETKPKAKKTRIEENRIEEIREEKENTKEKFPAEAGCESTALSLFEDTQAVASSNLKDPVANALESAFLSLGDKISKSGEPWHYDYKVQRKHIKNLSARVVAYCLKTKADTELFAKDFVAAFYKLIYEDDDKFFKDIAFLPNKLWSLADSVVKKAFSRHSEEQKKNDFWEDLANELESEGN
jgi:hypothetical protein